MSTEERSLENEAIGDLWARQKETTEDLRDRLAAEDRSGEQCTVFKPHPFSHELA